MTTMLLSTERYQAFLWKGETLTFHDSPRRKYVPARVAHRDRTVLPSCLRGTRLPGKGMTIRGRHGTGGILAYYPDYCRTRLLRCLDSIRKAHTS